MDDDVGASEHDDVKERLLIEGLQDWIHLSEIHQAFAFENHAKRPVAEAQALTLDMIREPVNEGLLVLGVPDKNAVRIQALGRVSRRSDGRNRVQVRDEFRGSLELGYVRVAGTH
jgi:hypothetical protein